jgi:hypothetical protein
MGNGTMETSVLTSHIPPPTSHSRISAESILSAKPAPRLGISLVRSTRKFLPRCPSGLVSHLSDLSNLRNLRPLRGRIFSRSARGIDPWKNTRLIGPRCKCSNAFSRGILIDRKILQCEVGDVRWEVGTEDFFVPFPKSHLSLPILVRTLRSVRCE